MARRKYEGGYRKWEKQITDTKCICAEKSPQGWCGFYITNRVKRDKEKGVTEGFAKQGHQWRCREFPEEGKRKMSENHADFSEEKNPNYGRGLPGENNPNWQGGKSFNTYQEKRDNLGMWTIEEKKFKKLIKDIDDNKCVLCDNTTRLVVHHIEPRSERSDLLWEQTNGVTLCITCHPRVDNKHHKDKYKVMLKAYVEQREKELR